MAVLARKLAAVLGRKPVAVAAALQRKLTAVGAVLGREPVVVGWVLGREPAAVGSVHVRKPAAVAMGIVAAASIEPAAQERRHSPGYRRDLLASTPGS